METLVIVKNMRTIEYFWTKNWSAVLLLKALITSGAFCSKYYVEQATQMNYLEYSRKSILFHVFQSVAIISMKRFQKLMFVSRNFVHRVQNTRSQKTSKLKIYWGMAILRHSYKSDIISTPSSSSALYIKSKIRWDSVLCGTFNFIRRRWC